jgi:hypothetical protein
MPLREYRSIHIHTLSSGRALVAGGLMLALFAGLALLAFWFFLLLIPVTIAAVIAFLLLPGRRSISLGHTMRHGPKIIETEYKVISETPHDDAKIPSQDDH